MIIKAEWSGDWTDSVSECFIVEINDFINNGCERLNHTKMTVLGVSARSRPVVLPSVLLTYLLWMSIWIFLYLELRNLTVIVFSPTQIECDARDTHQSKCVWPQSLVMETIRQRRKVCEVCTWPSETRDHVTGMWVKHRNGIPPPAIIWLTHAGSDLSWPAFTLNNVPESITGWNRCLRSLDRDAAHQVDVVK